MTSGHNSQSSGGGGGSSSGGSGNNAGSQHHQVPKKLTYRELFDQLTLGIVKSLLEKRVGVTDAHVPERKPVDRHALTQWEQKYSCLMPEDLRNFYSTTDGFALSWSVRFDEVVVPVGRMEINCLANLVRIGGPYPATHGGDPHHHHSGGSGGHHPSHRSVGGTGTSTTNLLSRSASAGAHLSASNDGSVVNFADLESDEEDDLGGVENKDSREGACACSPIVVRAKPRFDFRSRVFELEPCGAGNGKVCLVYHNTKPGIPAQDPKIWFLDRALRWHFMAESFTHYFRLMLMHVGLPQWQYAFTDIGLSPQVKQWFNLFAPVRLSLDARPYCCPSQNHTCKNVCTHAHHQRACKEHRADAPPPPSHTTTIDVNKVFKGRGDRKKGAGGIGAGANLDKKKTPSAKAPLK